MIHNLCMYVYIYLYLYVCMYVHVYIYIYIYIYTHTYTTRPALLHPLSRNSMRRPDTPRCRQTYGLRLKTQTNTKV